ncbi:MAG: hypothetical protein IJT03_04735 [Clostridia bacterium]|nr:hypothetical protein [Clostridia bacterium]
MLIDVAVAIVLPAALMLTVNIENIINTANKKPSIFFVFVTFIPPIIIIFAVSIDRY